MNRHLFLLLSITAFFCVATLEANAEKKPYQRIYEEIQAASPDDFVYSEPIILKGDPNTSERRVRRITKPRTQYTIPDKDRVAGCTYTSGMRRPDVCHDPKTREKIYEFKDGWNAYQQLRINRKKQVLAKVKELKGRMSPEKYKEAIDTVEQEIKEIEARL